jgi:hypothetical protein
LVEPRCEENRMTVEAATAAVEIAPNPIARRDPRLARAFEDAAIHALGEAVEAVVIRFSVWDGEDDGPRYVCKIEEAPGRAVGSSPAWRWWSPMVSTPAELSAHIREAASARARRAASGSTASVSLEYWGWGAAGHAGA